MTDFAYRRTTAGVLVGTKPRCGKREGRITAAGITKEVTFEPVDGEINHRIDDAYRAKYKGSPYLSPMIDRRARSVTARVTPKGS